MTTLPYNCSTHLCSPFFIFMTNLAYYCLTQICSPFFIFLWQTSCPSLSSFFQFHNLIIVRKLLFVYHPIEIPFLLHFFFFLESSWLSLLASCLDTKCIINQIKISFAFSNSLFLSSDKKYQNIMDHTTNHFWFLN